MLCINEYYFFVLIYILKITLLGLLCIKHTQEKHALAVGAVKGLDRFFDLLLRLLTALAAAAAASLGNSIVVVTFVSLLEASVTLFALSPFLIYYLTS